MKDERYTPEVGSWLKGREVASPDSQQTARHVAARLSQVRQRSRWWPLPVFRRASRPPTDQAIEYQPAPIPASSAGSANIAGRTQSMFSPAKAITAGALVFAIGGALLIAQPFDQQAGAPGATAPGEAVGTNTFVAEIKCNIGQDITMGYPVCEQDATGTLTLPFVSAEAMTGTFDGVRVQDGVLEYGANGDFTFSARGLFMGTVEGCGAGTVYFESTVEGVDVDGLGTHTSHTASVVSGGTLPVFGTLDMSGVETQNADGTDTLSYTGTYSCDSPEPS